MPVPVPHPQRSREIVVASMPDPFDAATEPGPIGSGVWSVTVFGLDPRCKLVAVPFFRRSAWHAVRAASGEYDPSRVLSGVAGEGYSVAECAAVVLRRDVSGLVHDVGGMPADVWLNGGNVPDGCELATGADGVRVEISFEVPEADSFVTQCSWDLVCALEVVPNEVLGCNGLADEIVKSLEVRVDPPVRLPGRWVTGT